jgi:uncharacterized spore protein YtfJ
MAAKAIVVIRDGDVKILPLAKPGAVEKIAEMIPEILERVPKVLGKKEAEKKEAEPEVKPVE